MLTLYATPGSGNCYKPFLALKQLSIPFRLQLVDVLAGETRGAAYRAINPAATVPYLRIAGGNGLGESNAMLWFIASGSHLMPGEPFLCAQALQWMFFEQSRLEPFISPARFLTVIAPARGRGRETEIATWQERAKIGLDLLDRHLGQSDFIAGSDYTIGDIGVFGYVHVFQEAGLDAEAFPSVRRWISRVEHTSGYVPMSAMLEATVPSAVRAA